MNDWAKTKSFSVIWKASNAKRFDLHKFWMNKQSLWSLTWQTFIWYEAKQICLCLNLTIKIQYRLTILKHKDWLVKSACKKKKNENSPPNTTIEKSWWLLCTKSRFTYNKANQLSKILFYQDISIFANAIYRNQHQTKSISNLPLAYIYTSSSRLSIAQTCVLKYHPKHADSTKNYPLIQSLFFLIVDIVKFAVTFGLTSRMVTIRAQAHLMSETSRWQKREKLCRAIQCKKLHQRSCHEARNQPK